MPTDKRSPSAAAIAALSEGTLEIAGRIPWSSNFTFLVDVEHDGQRSQAIYKPRDGEQDLWDFPADLYKREYAAYLLSVQLGWPNIPEMVIREDLEFGVGTLQRFVPSDLEQHYFTLVERPDFHEALKAIATFDVISNNADRKAGHCLLSDEGTVFAIDNALCFHIEPKLRTVIWDFGGQRVPARLLEDLNNLASNVHDDLAEWILPDEIDELQLRIRRLIEEPVLPQVVSRQQYPWPLV